MELNQKVYVLTGEGIECEREAAEFFKLIFPVENVQYLSLYSLFHDYEKIYSEFQKGDWIIIPGGFSFADHFGAGRLLSYRLQEIGFFQMIQDKALNCFGVCNGFQVLVASGIFGQHTQLLANKKPDAEKTFHFTDKWIQLSSPLFENLKSVELPVRHGEGRLQGEREEFQSLGVTPFLKYNDLSFDNGSYEQWAGIYRQMGQASIWGMMPHPEIAATKVNHPNCAGTERMPRFRKDFLNEVGDGLLLIQEIIKHVNAEKAQ